MALWRLLLLKFKPIVEHWQTLTEFRCEDCGPLSFQLRNGHSLSFFRVTRVSSYQFTMCSYPCYPAACIGSCGGCGPTGAVLVGQDAVEDAGVEYGQAYVYSGVRPDIDKDPQCMC
ncbi:hypothetical protein ACLKA6_012300 [Drosophila palustris]